GPTYPSGGCAREPAEPFWRIQTQEFSMTASSPNLHSLSQSSDALADAVEHVGRSVVAVHAGRHGTASGVLWRDGVVVTTAHTIARQEGIRITLPDGSRNEAALAGVDPSTDLAALTLDGEWLNV